MRKATFLLGAALLTLSSCTITEKSATAREVGGPIVSYVLADMDVRPTKITYTYNTTPEVRRGGYRNCVSTAIAEALKINGGGDVLVETQTAITTRKGWFSRKVKSVTVTGYPATYRNFRNADTQTLQESIVVRKSH